MTRARKPAEQFAIERVRVGYQDACWPYQGPKNEAGYGIIRANGRHYRAHRIMYELYVNNVPDGLVLDHLCRNRSCCNPYHLEPVTRGENVRRGNPGQAWGARQRAKTHCPHGHEYTSVNTRWSKGGKRHCRTCDRRRHTSQETPQ